MREVEKLEERMLLTVGVGSEWHFDFGTAKSPVAPGSTGVPLVSYNATRGYGWNDLDDMAARSRLTSNPLTRDFHLGSASTFKADLASGTYDVTVTLGDPSLKRDNVDLYAEGGMIDTGLTTLAGKTLTKTYTVQVTDGQLNLDLVDTGGVNGYFALDALDIVPHGSSTSLTANAGADVAANEGASVTFNATATGTGALTYNWNFGDGTTASGTLNAAHVYADNGTYTATLTVKDTSGKSVTDSAVVTVKNIAPTINAGGPYSATPGTAVAFKSTVTDPSSMDTAAGFTYSWNFGDGTTSTSANPSHAYTTAGNYTVSLTVKDKDGGTRTANTTAAISTSTSTGPTANAGLDIASNEGASVTFNAAATGTGPLTYSWNFGDGTTSTSTLKAAHVYADNGTYTATLSVKDANGKSITDSAVVTVKNIAPTATLSGSYTGTAGTAVSFNTAVTDPSSKDTAAGFTYSWNFGDGSTSTTASPSHVYTTAGSYVVALTVKDKDGGTSTAKSTATIGTSGGGGGTGDYAVPTVTLTKGWATFGEVLPQGEATGSVQIGSLPTQTDVKTTWPDGSIKYAILTAYVPADGQYQIKPGSEATGTFTPTIPTASVKFNVGGTVYTATLPKTASSDIWLDGALVHEQRFKVTPTTSGGTKQDSLSVIFDLRSYKDGGNRLDVTVEDTADKTGATSANYTVDIVANGQNLFHQDNVDQGYMTRWHKVFDIGLTESQETLDFRPFYEAGALPRYLSQVTNTVDSTNDPSFNILGPGALDPWMGDYGGRGEIAPYPDWTARYLVHQDPGQLAFVLAGGDLAGSWPIHLREADGSLVSIDERPDFWLDGRADPANRPAGDLNATGPLSPDIAHQPSLAYVPYLVTGDRYYADEMSFWANYDLIGTWQDPYYNPRGGSEGLLKDNQVRGFAWALRDMSDAAAYLPDNDPNKAYFTDKVENNLQWLDTYANGHNTPLGTMFEDKRPENDGSNKAYISPWEQNYLAWAIDHAEKQGFTGGEAARDKIVKFQIKLMNSPDYPRDYGAPYLIAVGSRDSSGNVTYYTSMSQVYDNTYFSGGLDKTDIPGWYGVDARLSLMIGIENGFAGAQSAYDWLNPQIATQPFDNGIPDLSARAGWAIALPNET
jgi:PKD repeat protein